MKSSRLVLSSVLAAAVTASATISGWVLDNSESYSPADSLSFTYQSDRDTTTVAFYVETGDASTGLDTSADLLHATIHLADNGTQDMWDEKTSTGWMPDGDPTDNAFLFAPGATGLAPALYHIVLSDADGMVSDTFRIEGISSPYRTVSGKVTPPAGEPAGWIAVAVYARNIETRFMAFTDTNGDYTIGLDQAGVDSSAGNIVVSNDKTYDGFIASPRRRDVNVGTGNATGVDFGYVAATSLVKGTVTGNATPIEDVRVRLIDNDGYEVGGDRTAVDGSYSIACLAGSLRLEVDTWEARDQWMRPGDTTVTVADGEDLVVDLSLYAADTMVYGRLTKDGSAPGGNFAFTANARGLGSNWDTTTTGGWFAIPVSSKASRYDVRYQNWNEFSQIPNGYVFENGTDQQPAAPGDTVYFNLVPKPAGGVSGTFTNSTSSVAARFLMRVYSADGAGRSYDFNTTSVGAYAFDGVADGKYYVEAGMSVQGEDEWYWKFRKMFTDPAGAKQTVTVAGAVLTDIDFEFTDADSTGTTPPPTSYGAMNVTVDNQTGGTADKCEITLWLVLPDSIDPGLRVRTLTVPVGKGAVVVGGIPDTTLAITARMIASDSTGSREYKTTVGDTTGAPIWFTFVAGDTQDVAIVFTADDTTGTVTPPPPTNYGVMRVSVDNQTGGVTDKCQVTLWLVLPDSMTGGRQVRALTVPVDKGPVPVGGIPDTSLAVSGNIVIIDSTGDREYWAVVRDTLGEPVWFAFAAGDTQDVTITFTAADTTPLLPPPPPPPTGKGILRISVENQTGHTVAMCNVRLWGDLPDSTNPGKEVRSLPIPFGAPPMTYSDIPEMILAITAGMEVYLPTGTVRYRVTAWDAAGGPAWFDFASGDTHTVALVITPNDTVPGSTPPPPVGEGVLRVTIDNQTGRPAEGCEISLWYSLPDSAGPGRQARTFGMPLIPEPTAVLSGIPQATLAVAARMKTDDTSGIVGYWVVASDTAGDPLWFAFTSGDTASVTITITADDTAGVPPPPPPVGNAALTVTIANQTGFVPAGYEVALWKMLPDSGSPGEPVRSFWMADTQESATIMGIPEGIFAVSGRMKIRADSTTTVGGELWTVVESSTGGPLWLTFTTGDTQRVDIVFTDADTVVPPPPPPPPPPLGEGVLVTTVDNQSRHVAGGYEVTLWKVLPDSGRPGEPVRTFGFADTTTVVTVAGVPQGSFAVSGRMKVMPDSATTINELWTVVNGPSGGPLWIEFASGADTQSVTIVFTDADTMAPPPPPPPMGRCILDVTVDNQSSYTADMVQVNLWKVLPDSGQPGERVAGYGLEAGVSSMVIEGVPEGRFAVSGRMRTAGDSTTAVVELAKVLEDGSGNPLWLDFKAGDTVKVVIVFTAADTMVPPPPPPPVGQAVLVVSVDNQSSYTPESEYEVSLYEKLPSAGEPGRMVRTLHMAPGTTTGTWSDIPAMDLAVAGLLKAQGDSVKPSVHLWSLVLDSSGAPVWIDFAKPDTVWVTIVFTDGDTAMPPPDTGKGPTGNAVLAITVTNSSSYPGDRAEVVMWDHVPRPGEQPVYARGVPIGAGEAILSDVPEMSLVIGAWMQISKDSATDFGLFAMAGATGGTPAVYNFTAGDTVRVNIVLTDADTLGFEKGQDTTGTAGTGSVSGVVTYTGSDPTAKVLVALRDENTDDIVDGTEPDSTGAYTIEGIGPGSYRVMAIVRLNGKQDGADGVSLSDSVLVFTTTGEAYTGIDLSVVERPVGTGSISGTLSAASTLPAGQILVAAVPVDTTRPLQDQMTPENMMMARVVKLAALGAYTLDSLADGVYVVVAAVEDTATGGDDLAVGAYGILVRDTTLEFPFTFTPVVVSAGSAETGIDFALVTKEDIVSIRTWAVAPAPRNFSFDRPVYQRQTGVVTLRYGVPASTRVSISVIDVTGRTLGVLVDREAAAGYHTIQWNTRGTNGVHAASGVYLCRMEADGHAVSAPVRILR